MRTQRILHLEDSLKEINKQISFKKLRREQANNSHKYQLCDGITQEITALKQQQFKQQVELKMLQCKQQQSSWYRKRKTTADSYDEQGDSTSTTSSAKSSQQISQAVK